MVLLRQLSVFTVHEFSFTSLCSSVKFLFHHSTQSLTELTSGLVNKAKVSSQALSDLGTLSPVSPMHIGPSAH